MYNTNDVGEKAKRKRVLISSDFKTAYKVSNIFDVYFELNQSRWCTEKSQSKKFKAFIKDNLNKLSQQYNGAPIYHPAPTFSKKQKIVSLESDEDEEEIQHREMCRKRKINKWKYSLANKDNWHTISEPKSEIDIKAPGNPAKGALTSITPTKKKDS
jgi:tRNA(Ile)-lysidine synthase TilS/MesJ